jgi:hypothetical protein
LWGVELSSRNCIKDKKWEGIGGRFPLMSFNSLLLIIHKFVILFIILIILWGVIKQKLHKRQKAGGWGGAGKLVPINVI